MTKTFYPVIMKMCKIHLVLYILCIVICFEYTLAKGPGKRLFSRRLEGHKIKTIVSISLNTCKDECQHREHCASLNYNRLKKICELNQDDDFEAFQLKVAAGWVFSAKDAWSMKQAGYCKDEPCKGNKEMACVETSNSFECKVKECKIENNILQNGIVLGNMNDVGSVLAVECHPGFALLGPNNSICDETGEWNSFNNMKCEILCPAPFTGPAPEIKDANIITPEGENYITGKDVSLLSSMMIKQGSTATYHCKNGMYLVESPVTTCTAGVWSPVPSCVSQCPLPLSYSYSLYACVPLESCTDGYAATFQKYEAKVMWAHDYASFLVPENECQEKCLSDPLCNSFDYCHNNRLVLPTCYLQKLNTVDSSSFRNRIRWSYHQRNCN